MTMRMENTCMRRDRAEYFCYVLLFVCSVALPLAAQDIDSVVTDQNRTVPTIAEEIADLAERAAFLALYQTQDPQRVQSLTRTFLQQYPQSAFLATVYERAARSSFDLGDLIAGLSFAHQSLTLFPENPLLLVAAADVQARTAHPEAALESARDALDYFDRFARPSAISEQNWPNIKRKQQATAWFVVGRVQMVQALAAPASAGQDALINQATASLSRAYALNPDDPEILYLLGILHNAGHNLPEAMADFGAVYKRGGDLALKARSQLLAIYNSQVAGTPDMNINFDMFLSNSQKAAPSASSQPSVVASPSAVHLPSYAGSAACKLCHADIYEQWTQTGMSKMLRPYQPQNVIGDFDKNNEFYAGDDITYRSGTLRIIPAPERKLFAHMVLHDGRHYFEIKQSDGQWHTYPVDYTIGSKWQQAYATTLPNGEIHVFPIQYSTIQKKWVNYWKVIDVSGSERSNPFSWERLDNATNYKINCAVCHTSQLRNTGIGLGGSDQLVFREPGIDCEMCHGPAGKHVASMHTGSMYTKNPIDPPVAFGQISNRQFVNVCAQCHMQSNLHTASPQGERNYSSTGTFFLTNESLPLDEVSRKGFYKDGRFNQTTFIVEALERSKCFRKGQVSCGSCHNPHSPDSSSNPTSLRFKDDQDRMCTGCHTNFENKVNAAAHTHHPIHAEASRCVSCHMPRIVDALLFRARSHQIDDIPNPEMTERFGQEESPNACLLCHTEKTPQWVQSSLQSWKR
jgi:predicted CXXCH cytochrome family protein